MTCDSRRLQRLRDAAGWECRASRTAARRPTAIRGASPRSWSAVICAVRHSAGYGPHRISWALGVARSTVYAVLRRFGLHRLDRLHRVSR